MSSEQVGIYLLLLCEEWARGPLSDEDLGLITPSEIPEVREVLKKCFRETPEGWINDTLEEVRAEQQEKAAKRSRAGKAGAKARWNKGRSGKRNATAEPSQSDTNGIRVDKRRIEEIREEEEAPTREGFDDFTLSKIRGLYGHNGSEGTDEKVWGGLTDKDDRNRYLLIAIDRLEGEKTPYQGRQFRRTLQSVIEEQAEGGGRQTEEELFAQVDQNLRDLGIDPETMKDIA